MLPPAVFEEFYRCWRNVNLTMQAHFSTNRMPLDADETVLKLSEVIRCDLGTGRLGLTQKRLPQLTNNNIIIIIIIIAEMAVFKVAGYLIEERRRRPVITAYREENIVNKFRILKERHIQMRKPYRLPGWTKNSSYYSAPVGDRTHDLPPL